MCAYSWVCARGCVLVCWRVCVLVGNSGFVCECVCVCVCVCVFVGNSRLVREWCACVQISVVFVNKCSCVCVEVFAFMVLVLLLMFVGEIVWFCGVVFVGVDVGVFAGLCSWVLMLVC